MAAVNQCKCFSLQAESSTDIGNTENELFLVLYFDSHSADGKVYVGLIFFTVWQLGSGTASGLMECLERALLCIWALLIFCL